MHMFLMGIFWYHLYDMSNYKLCNLDTYNHNFGSSVELQMPRSKSEVVGITFIQSMVIAAHAIA